MDCDRKPRSRLLYGSLCGTGPGGVRISHHSLRFETQRGEIAVSAWLGTEQNEMDAPLFFAHPADSRTALSDASVRTRAGIGWRRAGSGLHGGGRTIGVVAPWWVCLLALMALSQWRLLVSTLTRRRGNYSSPGDQSESVLP